MGPAHKFLHDQLSKFIDRVADVDRRQDESIAELQESVRLLQTNMELTMEVVHGQRDALDRAVRLLDQRAAEGGTDVEHAALLDSINDVLGDPDEEDPAEEE